MTSPNEYRPGKPTQLTQLAVIQADPAAGTQISGPLALMWEPSTSEDRPRRALACSFSLCRDPACPCREVQVYISVVDDRITGIRDESGCRIGIFCGPEIIGQLSVHWGDATLDLDSGELTLNAVGDGTKELGSANSGESSIAQVATLIGDLFRRSADAALLGHLRERWRALKGRTDDWKKFDWSWFEPGEMVGWHDAFPKGADGAFEVDRRMVVPIDMYCVDPACDCAEAMVDFVVVPDAQNERSRTIGRVAVGLTSGKARNFEPKPGASKLLRAAWKEYSAHSDLSRVFTERQRCMKNVGRELFKNRTTMDASGPAVSAPSSQPKRKVGPNEPCPCGSGVKFKRCCMT